jgi:hypothetical protein
MRLLLLLHGLQRRQHHARGLALRQKRRQRKRVGAKKRCWR